MPEAARPISAFVATLPDRAIPPPSLAIGSRDFQLATISLAPRSLRDVTAGRNHRRPEAPSMGRELPLARQLRCVRACLSCISSLHATCHTQRKAIIPVWASHSWPHGSNSCAHGRLRSDDPRQPPGAALGRGHGGDRRARSTRRHTLCACIPACLPRPPVSHRARDRTPHAGGSRRCGVADHAINQEPIQRRSIPSC